MEARAPVVAWPCRKADSRLYPAMHTLLYPGVLGSLMYALPDNILSGRTQFTVLGTSLAIALFFAFVADYLHSTTDDAKNAYSNGTFIADFAIVVLVFVAGQKILGTPLLPGVSEFWFLAGAKLCAVFWESVKYPGPSEAATDNATAQPCPVASTPTARGTDLAFMMIYLLVGVLTNVSDGWYRSALALALFADALWYFIFRYTAREQ